MSKIYNPCDGNSYIAEYTQTIATQFYDKQEQAMIDSVLKDISDNPSKYPDNFKLFTLEREKLVEVIKLGIEQYDLKYGKRNSIISELVYVFAEYGDNTLFGLRGNKLREHLVTMMDKHLEDVLTSLRSDNQPPKKD